ncbi:MAG: AAA family ATPase [Nanoarchaeota archaeon]|nr:AAA family ATPase [Nanoarchaeota archaeon]
MIWTIKHQPKTVDELVISEDTKKRFLKFVLEYKKEKKNALLLWGEIGIGKTLLPITFAKAQGYEIIELNASTQRSKKMIEENLKNMATTASIFGNKKIILIDEIDCLGRTDRGALDAIIKTISITKHPIILTARDYWDSKISKLRKHVLGLEVKSSTHQKKIIFLKKMLQIEKSSYDEEALNKIIQDNDFRSVITDIHTLHYAGGVITKNLKMLSSRRKKQNVKNTVHNALTSQNFVQALKELNDSEADINELTKWFSENLLYYNASLNNYLTLAQADVFGGRILRRQYWRFAYYQRLLLSSINSLNGSQARYPELFKKMFITRSKRAKMDSITEKLGEKLHASKKSVRKYYVPLLRTFSKQELETFDLDKEEINFLIN